MQRCGDFQQPTTTLFSQNTNFINIKMKLGLDNELFIK
ncbi:MAG: hypothetical protein RI894_2616 [Bacteroidota bacterium]|jgi:hypothetical protein